MANETCIFCRDSSKIENGFVGFSQARQAELASAFIPKTRQWYAENNPDGWGAFRACAEAICEEKKPDDVYGEKKSSHILFANPQRQRDVWRHGVFWMRRRNSKV